MRNQTQDFKYKINALNTTNSELHNYIKNRFDDEVRRGQEQLRNDREVFNTEKTRFMTYEEKQRSNLNTLSSEIDNKKKTVEMREKQLTEQEEKIQKREDDFDTSKRHWNDQLSDTIKDLEKRANELTMFGKRVEIWAEERICDTIRKEKKMKDQ